MWSTTNLKSQNFHGTKQSNMLSDEKLFSQAKTYFYEDSTNQNYTLGGRCALAV